MAAAAELYTPELVDLRYLRGADLEPVLEEEKLAWRTLLRWDFSASAELVSRFLRMQALMGQALVVADRVVGYCYHVSEDQKGLIGDLFVCRDYASTANEDLLLNGALQSMVLTGLRRIEAQLMMLRGPFERKLPYGQNAGIYGRNFMLADLADLAALPVHPGAGKLRFETWGEFRQDEAATLIANTYHGHVDSCINDQYKSLQGARRFLTNIVQYPGCGSFWAPASMIARRPDGKIGGMILASLVASDVGHITQVCVAPDSQGAGIGYELLRRAACLLARENYDKVSLTVTASNDRAISLYHRMGFRAMRRFAAYVWDGL